MALFIWLVIVYFTRYVSLGSIIAALFVVVAMILTNKPLPYILFSIIGTSLVIFRHIANIKRLLKGTENKLGIRVNIPKGGER